MLSWALVLGLAALFAGLGVGAGQRADALDALTPEQSATAEIEPAGSFEHSLRSASTTTSPIELLNQPPRLALELWSRGLVSCIEEPWRRLHWRISGGVPPYTLTIDGQPADTTRQTMDVFCGLRPTDPQPCDPEPTLHRTFRAVATDSRGVTVTAETQVEAAAPPIRAAPGAVLPTGVLPSGPVGAALRLGWTAVRQGTAVCAYELRYQSTDWDATSWPDSWTAINEAIEDGKTEYLHDGLDSERRYRYQVRARNNIGAGDWSRAFPETGARPGTAMLAARTAASGSVALSWSTPPAGAERWEYRRRPDSGSWGGWTAIADSDGLTTSHTVTGLTEDARYHLQLRAVGAGGAGRASAAAVAVAGLTPSEGWSLHYRGLDSTGGAARSRSYVFLKDADDLTSGAATFAEVSSAEALLLNTDGYSDYTDVLATVQVGDRFTWHLYYGCWYHYRVTAILADPPARKLFRIALVTEDPCSVAAARDGDARSFFNESRDIYATFSWNLPPPSEPRIGADGIRIFPHDYPVEGGHTYRLSEYGSPGPIVIDVPADMRLIDGGVSENFGGTWTAFFVDEASGAILALDFYTGSYAGRYIPPEHNPASGTRDVGTLFDEIVESARVQPWR